MNKSELFQMSTSTQSLVKKKLAKIARMVLAGIGHVQIAAASGVSEGRISQILKTEDYKAEEELIAAEKFEEMDLLNQGWDGIENLGVQRVMEALQYDPEPEFALRAAAVANKAARRGGRHGQQMINPQNAGVRAIINLKAEFIEKLQQNFVIGGEAGNGETGANGEMAGGTELAVNQKDSDFMGAKSVQQLLHCKKENKGQPAIGEIIADEIQKAAQAQMYPEIPEIKAEKELLAGIELDF